MYFFCGHQRMHFPPSSDACACANQCARARVPFLFPSLSACNCIDIAPACRPFLALNPMPAPTQTAPTRAATCTPHAAAKHTPPAPLGAPERPSPLATRAPLFTPYNIPLPSPSSPAHQQLTIRSYHANPSPPNPPAAHHPQHRLEPRAPPRRPVRRLAQPAVGPLSPTHHIVTLEHTA